MLASWADPWAQEDDHLADVIARYYLVPPSTLPYNLFFPNDKLHGKADGAGECTVYVNNVMLGGGGGGQKIDWQKRISYKGHCRVPDKNKTCARGLSFHSDWTGRKSKCKKTETIFYLKTLLEKVGFAQCAVCTMATQSTDAIVHKSHRCYRFNCWRFYFNFIFYR